jgi:hypothetical protein
MLGGWGDRLKVTTSTFIVVAVVPPTARSTSMSTSPPPRPLRKANHAARGTAISGGKLFVSADHRAHFSVLDFD